MAVQTADLLEAINALWDVSGLDQKFRELWPDSVNANEFLALHDQEAGGEQPFPYCVLEVGAGSTGQRMSKGTADLWAVRDVPVTFRIHAKQQGAKTGKQIAAQLAEEVMKVFGGHPTVVPDRPLLHHGSHLATLYQNDFSLREGNDQWVWTVRYLFRTDVPETI